MRASGVLVSTRLILKSTAFVGAGVEAAHRDRGDAEDRPAAARLKTEHDRRRNDATEAHTKDGTRHDLRTFHKEVPPRAIITESVARGNDSARFDHQDDRASGRPRPVHDALRHR